MYFFDRNEKSEIQCVLGMEVIILNKKISLMVLVLVFVLFATPYVGMVSAKPTSAANNDNFASFVWHSEGGIRAIRPGFPETNPPWAEYPSPDVRVEFGQADWYLNPDFSNYVQIGEGSPITIDAETGYEGHLYVQVTYFKSGDVALNYRVYERIMWADNYVEIMCLERASLDNSGAFPVFSASGTFSGHGQIDGQKVQVTGIRTGVLQPPFTMVLDCTGTIRFLGNGA